MKKIYLTLIFLIAAFFFLKFPVGVKAIVNEPCKVCSGTSCVTQASPPNCTNYLNECATKYDCGWTPPVTDPCKVCNGTRCRSSGISPCSNSYNECNSNADCGGGGPTPTPTPTPPPSSGCYCTSGGGCSEQPGSPNCSTILVAGCGAPGCSSTDKAYNIYCGVVQCNNGSPVCAYDVNCTSYLCTTNRFQCTQTPGNNQCGGGGCSNCERQLYSIDCSDLNPTHCGNVCKVDSSCGASCGGGGTPGPTSTPPPVPSCAVTFTPTSATLPAGVPFTMTANVSFSNGTIDNVNFGSSNTGVFTVNPASDATTPYQTQVTGVALGGPATLSADVYMGGTIRCGTTASVTVAQPGPWWQTKDADVTANGNIISEIPLSCSLPACNPLFDLVGPGGYPGVPAYGGSANFGIGEVSTPGWLANTTSLTSNNRQYTYAWFKRLIPADVTINEVASSTIDGTALSSGGTASGGYYYYHYNGSSGLDLTIDTDASLGTRKVILLAEGADLYLNGRINFTKGQGFFMAIVGKTLLGAKGNIFVSSSLGGVAPQLEGLYEADNAFHSGAGTSQLHIRGSVAAYGGMNLERDLTDNSATPAEVFEYAPDLVFTYPYKLRERRIFWQEVAP